MTLRLALTTDTHLRPGAYGDTGVTRHDLPAPLWAAIDAADVVVHAGDWMDPGLLDALEARAARVVGCWGNNDGDALRARLPEVAHAELEGLRMAVLHETGDAARRERRVDGWFADGTDVRADLVVFGHSHIPWDSTTPAGIRLLNPGSPLERRREPVCTFMTATVADGALVEVRRHDLP